MFQDRIDAGKRLAKALDLYAGRSDVIVLGLPRGGVPVANEIALQLGAELDVIIVRKLGHPRNRELAIGAIASGGICVLNEELPVPDDILDMVRRKELAELRRRETAYRGDRPFPKLADRCVILVDDGLATGSTMRSAVKAARQKKPKEIIVAVPVAPEDTVLTFQQIVDHVFCIVTSREFYAIGAFYKDFSQTSDEDVKAILDSSWRRGDTL